MPVDLSQSSDSTYQLFESFVQADSLSSDIYLRIWYDLSRKANGYSSYSIPIEISTPNPSYIVTEVRMISNLSILVNKSNQILIQSEFVKDNTPIHKIIGDKIHDYYFNKEKIRTNLESSKIILIWSKGCDPQILSNIIYSILEGYQDATQRYSKQLFNAELCSLDTSQISILKKDVPFSLQFGKIHFAPIPIIPQ